MKRPRFANFGSQLRSFLLKHAFLGVGLYRWFREEVGLEDRYIRRWTRGDVLPSEDNWIRFTDALRRRDSATDRTFEDDLLHVESILIRARNSRSQDGVTVESLVDLNQCKSGSRNAGAEKIERVVH